MKKVLMFKKCEKTAFLVDGYQRGGKSTIMLLVTPITVNNAFGLIREKNYG